VSSTPSRTSVDQFDIVNNIGLGRVPAKAAGNGARGTGSARPESSRGRGEHGGDRDSDRPLTEAEKAARQREYAESEQQLDRDWYDNDEGGAFVDESGAYDPFIGGADGNAGTRTLDGRPKKKTSARQQVSVAEAASDEDAYADVC